MRSVTSAAAAAAALEASVSNDVNAQTGDDWGQLQVDDWFHVCVYVRDSGQTTRKHIVFQLCTDSHRGYGMHDRSVDAKL